MLLAMINLGVCLTKGLIWGAFPFYLLGWVTGAKAGADAGRLRRARRWLTVGFVFYLLHLLMGFQNFFGWSHEAAYEVMALQTYDLFEVRSGAAIYLNYFFTVLWTAEVLWAWTRFERWRQRPRWISRLVHAFMLLVWLCGMIAFASGPVRWYSAILLGVAVAWRLIPIEAQKPAQNAG